MIASSLYALDAASAVAALRGTLRQVTVTMTKTSDSAAIDASRRFCWLGECRFTTS